MAGAWGASWGAAFGNAFGLLTPLQPPAVAAPGGQVGAGVTIRGKRRTLTQDPYLRKLQKQFEDDAPAAMAALCAPEQFAAPENHFVDASNMVHKPRRTRATRESEFFALQIVPFVR